MKIIFFGSDDFAATHLEQLMISSHEIVACVTQPDRPKNRGMKMIMSPIKECAQKHHIPVLQPSNVKDEKFIEELKRYQADLFIVIAYGRILPKEVLDIPKLDSINVHGSLLPKYRGAAPINWAIINGDTETGLTIIKMNTAMDAGDIIAMKKIMILPEDTSATLRARMMQEGAGFLLETINRYDQWIPQQQDESQVTIASKLNKELGHIDWTQSAQKIHNLIRGLQPWPSAYTFYKDKQLKILKAEVCLCEEQSDVAICDVKIASLRCSSQRHVGEVIEIHKQGLIVSVGESALLLKEVQLSGSKRMDAASFVRGHHVDIGFLFTSKMA